MKKKLFETPELELIVLSGADVITASGAPMDGKGNDGTEGYGDVTDLGGGDIGQPLQ